MIILGIETSCDETSAAVVEDGKNVLSCVVASQADMHNQFGGVVPELASRKHCETIVSVVNQALLKAGISKNRLDGVAVTQGPGLVGALLVGFSFAKAFAFSLNIPLVGVNHLEGHIASVFLENNPPKFPFAALLASGGHTNIYHVLSHKKYELMGQTRDDAAGEAYDKVSKALGLGYPGGKIIDDLAAMGDPQKIIFPRPFLDKNKFDFSFSGLKTAVKRYIDSKDKISKSQTKNIAAGFQKSVTDVLAFKILNAAIQKRCDYIAVVGGVAANKGLQAKVKAHAKKAGKKVCIPSLLFCGDNGAMIAAAGYHNILQDKLLSPTDDVYSKVPFSMSPNHS